MYYSPSAQTAWESVYYIQYEMHGGWLLRGMHHFMAQAMVVLLALHLMQVVIDGAYRAPREVNFWLGLILMQIVLGLSLTGYLLPWDQKGYWATRVATNLLGVVPVVGPALQQLVVGGADYGHHTLTRFFALHAGVLPALLVVLSGAARGAVSPARHSLQAAAEVADTTFWPDQVLKDAVACLAVLVVVLLLCLHPARVVFWRRGAASAGTWGAELGAPADPSNQYSAARPEWYFLFLFQFLKLFEGWGEQGELLGAIVIPGLVMGCLFLMPLIGRWKLGHRFNIGFMLSSCCRRRLPDRRRHQRRLPGRWTDRAAVRRARCRCSKSSAPTTKRSPRTSTATRPRSPTTASSAKPTSTIASRRNIWKPSNRAEVESHRAIELASGPERIPARRRDHAACATIRSTQGPQAVRRALCQLPHASAAAPTTEPSPLLAERPPRRICTALPTGPGSPAS